MFVWGVHSLKIKESGCKFMLKQGEALTYTSFSVREHLKTSGVAITPQPLKRPSPNERETSRIPSTRPSLQDISKNRYHS